MANVSRKKTEQRAITKVRALIDDTEILSHNFNENDKGISFDGTIDVFKGGIDKKSNFEGSIKVQIKGRTVKSIKDKTTNFSIQKNDLNNFLKEDGGIFIVVNFLISNHCKYSIYTRCLDLAYLKKLESKMVNNPNKELKIQFEKVEKPEDFEKLCINFKTEQNIQKHHYNLINNLHNINPACIDRMVSYNQTKEGDLLESILTKEYSLYTYDTTGNLIDISSIKFNFMVEKIKSFITTKDENIKFDGNIITYENGEKIISFGKSFTMSLDTPKIDIKIKGSFHERLKAIKFLKSIRDNGGFNIKETFIKIPNMDISDDDLNRVCTTYDNIKKFMDKHGISRDLNFDNWDNSDFNRLQIIISSIENNTAVKIDNAPPYSMIGSYNIKDLTLSLFAPKQENGLFRTYSIWNSEKNFGTFKMSMRDGEDIIFNNKYLVLNEKAYYSDDINYGEMKKSIINLDFNEDNRYLINCQVLNLIKVYDETRNKGLLCYAMWLTDKLISHSDDYEKGIYFINKCQISERLGFLSKDDKERLFKIKESSTDTQIKISCNLLLGNKLDAELYFNQLELEAKNIFKNFPIAKYFN